MNRKLLYKILKRIRTLNITDYFLFLSSLASITSNNSDQSHVSAFFSQLFGLEAILTDLIGIQLQDTLSLKNIQLSNANSI